MVVVVDEDVGKRRWMRGKAGGSGGGSSRSLLMV